MILHSKGLARTKALLTLLLVAASAISLYVLASEVSRPNLPPSCSGYPPGGNCHANYSYNFTITLNYSGYWRLNYYGFHNGEFSGPYSNSYYLASGNISGKHFDSIPVTLTGDNYHFLTLCLGPEA